MQRCHSKNVQDISIASDADSSDLSIKTVATVSNKSSFVNATKTDQPFHSNCRKEQVKFGLNWTHPKGHEEGNST